MRVRIVVSTGRRFVQWPGWPHLGRALILGGLFTVWFAAIYAGADAFTQHRLTRVRVHFDFERHIPFVPAMTVAYMSIYPLFWLGPFVLRQKQELQALVKVLALTTLLGGVGFLLLPAELAFEATPVSAPWKRLYATADALNLDYNLVPSLHVALATACVAVYTLYAGSFASAALWLWCAVIAASTMLTHQHHLLDVVTGFVLGLALGRKMYPRWARAEPESVDRTAT